MNINLGIINIEAQKKILNNSLQDEANWFQTEINRINKSKKSIQNLEQRDELTTRLFISSGWPPPLDFPANQLDELMDGLENLKKEEFIRILGEILIEFYDNSKLDEMHERWNKDSSLSNRMYILEEGLLNYRENRFASCVALILPNIEGLVAEYKHEKPKMSPKESYIDDVFNSIDLDTITRQFYNKILWSSFDWFDGSEDIISRHQIFHGKNVTFGTQENALKILLIFDAFQQAIFDKKMTKNK